VHGALLAALTLALTAGAVARAAAQVILRPSPGATVIPPTFEPPFRVTIHAYVTGHDGAIVLPGRGVTLRLTDPRGRRVGVDPASGQMMTEIPGASYDVAVVNPQPNAPVGPRGFGGSGIALADPPDGRYVLEITGVDRVGFELAVAQWDRAGRRAWMHYARGATEPGAVDRYDITYTASARPSIDLAERHEQSYLAVRAYGRPPRSDEPVIVAELLLTDPRSRRLGLEPKTKRAYSDIPRASYGDVGGDSPGRELEIMAPADGTYALEVIGTRAGRYELSMHASDRDGQSARTLEVANLPTAAGAIHRFAVEYASTPAARPLRLTGAYGQGDRLLTYAHPTGPRVDVAAAQSSVAVIVFYAPTIAPRSFRAMLDGRDVSGAFRPSPGEREAVTLAVARGTHTLTLTVGGVLPDGRTSSHTDRFELVRR
jgi:hypothetical protein